MIVLCPECPVTAPLTRSVFAPVSHTRVMDGDFPSIFTMPEQCLRSVLLLVCGFGELQVPSEYLQQRTDLPGHIAKPVEPDLRHMRDLDFDPVALVRS